MNYSNVSRVRTEAGFDGNDNVTDSYIQAYLDQATQVVNGYVWFRYVPSTFSLNFSGSQAEATLKRCEELLAAGYLMRKEYPSEQSAEQNGKAKIDQAEAMLKSIKDGQILLLDSTENIYPQQARNPSAGSAILNIPSEEEAPRAFSTQDIY